MKYRTRIYYTGAQKAVMWQRWRQGWALHQIAHLFDRAHTSVQGILSRTGGIEPPRRTRAAIALTLPEREEVSGPWPRGSRSAKLNAVARQLNERPRKTPGFKTPAEMFSQTVALIG